MKILHLEASRGWGGQEIRILREAEGMRARGHEVLLAVMKKGALVAKAKAAGFKVYELEFRRLFWPKTLILLLWILKKEKIDLVNTHSSLDSWIGGIAARLARKRVVRTRHLSTPIKKGFNSKFVYGKLADFVVTTCELMVSIIAKQSGKAIEDLKSIPTGVDPGSLQVDLEEVRRFRKEIGGQYLVGTACSMRSWKGIDDLLGAAHLLREEKEIKWVIIGGGHAQRHIEKAKELRLEGIVFFTGHLESPFSAIAALDLFALLSTAHEGISQAALQAAYLEKPLICTPVGGLSEVCLDGVTGKIVPPFSAENVAKAVMQLMKDEELRKKMGKKGKELVLEKFTFKQTLDQMEEIFKKFHVESKDLSS